MTTVYLAAPAFAAPPDDINWSDFLNTLVWASMGYDALGCIAGEVKNPGRTYPLGITVSAAETAAARVCVGGRG